MHLTYDMRIGGTEMVIKNIIQGSDTNQFDMSIFCIEQTIGPWGIELQNAGLNISAVERKPGFDVSLIFAIRKHLKKHKIDVIHCHQYTPWVYGVLGALATKTKVVFTEHGRFHPDSSTWKRKLVNPWLCKITVHIAAISKATKQALIDFENIPENRIDVIYNGINPPKVDPQKTTELRIKLKIPQDAKVLGTIARLDPIKNHRMMLEAFSLVLEDHPNTFLIIVGDGEERDNILKQIEVLNIKDKVIMPGYDPQPQHYLALMDIFLLSSLSEGTSMTLLEAMSLSKPCVATNAGGNAEIVKNNVTGFVTKNDVATDYHLAICRLLDDKTLTQKLAKNGKEEFIDTFTVHHMTQQYSQLYKTFE
ncbi:MAG: glycosyltransferase involved in cell wall biosynthesis [Paraglaciecola sp.]|jgi:glycosyltransferase involved in cell wall biosynthesis